MRIESTTGFSIIMDEEVAGWLFALVRDESMSSRTIAVAYAYAIHISADLPTGTISTDVSITELCSMTHMSVRTVHRARQDLIRLGWLSSETGVRCIRTRLRVPVQPVILPSRQDGVLDRLRRRSASRGELT